MRSIRTLLAAAVAAAPLATSLVGLAPVANASHDVPEKIYVGQRGLHNLAVLTTDLAPFTTPSIALGAAAVPQELIADPVRPYLYVADSGLNAVHVVNTNSDVLETSIPTSAGPQGLALSSDGHTLFVTTATKVEKIDTRSRKVVSSVSMSPFTPWDLTLSADGAYLWVTNGGTSGEVRTLNPTTLAQIGTHTPAGATTGYGIVGSPAATTDGYVNVIYADQVMHAGWSINEKTGVTGGLPGLPASVAGPWALELGRGSDDVLITDGGGSATLGGDTFFHYDVTTATSQSLSSLGGSAGADSPTEIAISPTEFAAYVTLRATNKVSKISYGSSAPSEVAVGSLAASADPYGIEVVRAEQSPLVFAGSDRYKTAALASQEQFADRSADALVVSRGDAFPDGLSAGPLSSFLDGPLLLSKPGSLPDPTKDEVARTFDGVDDPEADVYVVGGTAAISAAVVSAIQAIDSKLDVERIDGANRVETSVNVAKKIDALRGQDPTTVFLAKSTDYPDALTASGFGGNAALHPTVAPVLLNPTEDLDASVESYLEDAKPNLVQAYLMGGTAALSTDVAGAVGGIVTTTRLGGANRYATAITAAKNFFPSGPTALGFASGENFPDALVLGPFVGRTDASGQTASYSLPIIPVKKASVPSEVSAYMATLSKVVRSFVGGGDAAVSSTTVATLGTLY